MSHFSLCITAEKNPQFICAQILKKHKENALHITHSTLNSNYQVFFLGFQPQFLFLVMALSHLTPSYQIPVSSEFFLSCQATHSHIKLFLFPFFQNNSKECSSHSFPLPVSLIANTSSQIHSQSSQTSSSFHSLDLPSPFSSPLHIFIVSLILILIPAFIIIHHAKLAFIFLRTCMCLNTHPPNHRHPSSSRHTPAAITSAPVGYYDEREGGRGEGGCFDNPADIEESESESFGIYLTQHQLKIFSE